MSSLIHEHKIVKEQDENNFLASFQRIRQTNKISLKTSKTNSSYTFFT